MGDLKVLAQLGKISEEREVLTGIKVRMQTLTSTDQEAVTSMIEKPEDTISRYPALLRQFLTKATISINDNSDRTQIEEYYKECQYQVAKEIYIFYLELEKKQNSVIDELKKNLKPQS